MDEKLVQVLKEFSDNLHELEGNHIDLPEWLDDIWVEITNELIYYGVETNA